MGSGQPINLSSVTEGDRSAVESELSKILASPEFKSAHQMKRFLAYIVDKALKGKARELKQFTIAVEALGFAEDFDSDSNPAVRILGGRVRDRLNEYYQQDWNADLLTISIPKGSYIPLIEKKSVDNTDIESRTMQSQGPKLGLFCLGDEKQSIESNLLLEQITSALAKELSRYIFLRLYVQIPYQGKARSDVIGKDARRKFNVDFTLLLFIQELPKDKYELVYRLWDNDSEEVISSEIFNVHRGQAKNEQSDILNQISALVADFYQGKLHIYWARKLLKDEGSIPEHYQTQVYHRYFADNLGHEAFKKAIYYCSKALERDSQDIIANVIFADYCRREYVYSFNAIDDPLGRGKQCAETAIRLRPDSHEAHFVFAQILFCLNEWQRSISEFNFARDISKNHTVIEYGTGFHFCMMGQWQEGLLLVQKAMKLSDSYPSWYHIVPFLDHYRKEEYKEALDEAQKIMVPNLIYAPLARCAAYGQLGESDKAQQEIQDLLSLCPDFFETGKQILTRFLGTEEFAEKVWEGVIKAKTGMTPP